MSHILFVLAYVACLICFIMILIKMFQTGNTGWGIATIVLWVCFSLGYVLALIWGWQRVGTVVSQRFMLIYTILIVVLLLVGGYGWTQGIFKIPG